MHTPCVTIVHLSAVQFLPTLALRISSPSGSWSGEGLPSPAGCLTEGQGSLHKPCERVVQFKLTSFIQRINFNGAARWRQSVYVQHQECFVFALGSLCWRRRQEG
jgi:hypothetical protein